jgi:hypothetical protein
LSSNIRTRSQAEATILRAKEIQNEEPVQERARYNEILQQVKKKRMLLQQQLREDEEQEVIRRRTLQLKEHMAIVQAQLNSIQPQEPAHQPCKTHDHN